MMGLGPSFLRFLAKTLLALELPPDASGAGFGASVASLPFLLAVDSIFRRLGYQSSLSL